MATGNMMIANIARTVDVATVQRPCARHGKSA